MSRSVVSGSFAYNTPELLPLWMSEEELGFDPTIMTAKGQRFIEIEREGTIERLIQVALMRLAGSDTAWEARKCSVRGSSSLLMRRPRSFIPTLVQETPATFSLLPQDSL